MPAAPIKKPTLADLRLWIGDEESERYGSDRAAMEKIVFAQATGNGAGSLWCDFMEWCAGDAAFLRMCAWVFAKMPENAEKPGIMMSAFELAAGKHFLKAASWLVKNGLDLRSPLSSDGAALHVASVYRRPAVVKLLLSKGCDPNAPNGDGKPPLFLMLLNLGQYEEGGLFPVSHSRALETAKLLVGAGAKLEAKIGRKKESAIALASGPLKAWLESLEIRKGAGEGAALPKLGRRKF